MKLTRYVNTYELDQRYGGPEEGGWWYTTLSPVESKKILGPSRFAFWLMRRKQEVLNQNRGDWPLDSVNYDGGTCSAFVENQPAQAWPEQRPHYE